MQDVKFMVGYEFFVRFLPAVEMTKEKIEMRKQKSDSFAKILRRSPRMEYFHFCLTVEDYEKAKPDPEPYLKAIEKSGFRPDECLVVEDSERGLLAAVAAGLRCMVVPRGLTGDGNFSKAYGICSNLDEVVDEILKEI